MTSFEQLITSINSLTLPTKNLVIDVFYNVVKVLQFRLSRTKKPELKITEIAGAIYLVQFHYFSAYKVRAEGELARKFGEIEEEDAVRFFKEFVVGEVTDQYGRKIIINENRISHLYKDGEEAHIPLPEYFQPSRGKRLPWIKPILANSKEIYIKSSKGKQLFAYVAHVTIRLKHKDDVITLHIVIARKKKASHILFITSYSIDQNEDFLRAIEKFRPYLGE